MNDLVLWLCCVVPIVCMTLVTGGAGFLAWRVIARIETQSRDMLKAVLSLSQSPASQQLAGMMEGTDARALAGQADPTSNNGPRSFRRQAT